MLTKRLNIKVHTRCKTQMYHKHLEIPFETIFANNQLEARFFFMYIYFCSLRVSGSHVPIIRRINCIN